MPNDSHSNAMRERGKVGFIFAHPDDETFMCACLIRQLADEGEQPALLLATKGDAGKKNGDVAHLTNEQLAEVRVREMEEAAGILGLAVVEHLGYPDGKLKDVGVPGFRERVEAFINRHRLRIVFSFPADGGNFHPDHMAISKIATAAVTGGRCPTVQKLYYVVSDTLLAEGRQPAIEIEVEPQWDMKAAALRAHQSQIYAIHRYFGDLTACLPSRKYESFVLGWERGAWWPVKRERTIFDDLQ